MGGNADTNYLRRALKTASSLTSRPSQTYSTGKHSKTYERYRQKQYLNYGKKEQGQSRSLQRRQAMKKMKTHKEAA